MNRRTAVLAATLLGSGPLWADGPPRSPSAPAGAPREASLSASPLDRARIAVLDESEKLEEQIGETRARLRERVRSFYRLQRAGGGLAPSSPESHAAATRVRFRLARRVIGRDLGALRAAIRRAEALDDLRARLRREPSAPAVRGGPPAAAPVAEDPLPAFTSLDRAGTLVVHGAADVPFASLKGNLPLPIRGTTDLEVRPRGSEVEIAGGPAAIAQAVARGRVEYAGDYAGLGKLVIVDHGGPWHTVTGGLVTLAVGRGAAVEPGQAIGVAGPTVTFEVRREGRPIDTMAWLGLR
ncbi:MAG: peptidoglycan DD-metalloendopeptidase family protein [Deltaproteobacteria bacterium]|nr:peptidoglycan DD-metalloendopeptidase family protein [Deltaproteobacteria bacterium]